MRTMILTLIMLTFSAQTFACSCVDSEGSVIYSLAEMQSIDTDDITLSNVKETYNFIYALPNVIRSSTTRDEGRACMLSCSKKGVRITAHAEYRKNNQICTATLIKPARFEYKLTLKNIKCD